MNKAKELQEEITYCTLNRYSNSEIVMELYERGLISVNEKTDMFLKQDLIDEDVIIYMIVNSD